VVTRKLELCRRGQPVIQDEVDAKPRNSWQGSDSTITYTNEDSEADLLARMEEDDSSSCDLGLPGNRLRLDKSERIDEKEVRFSRVDFRVFYTSLGDNPVSLKKSYKECDCA
jgi:hypothetical protein